MADSSSTIRSLSFTASPHGELEEELRALGRIGVESELPLVLLDDAVAHGEPEAGSLAGLLGGEEGLEDPRARRLRDAGAGVAEARADEAPAIPIVAAHADPQGLGPIRCIGGHRVQGVQREIEADLHELVLGRLHEGDVAAGGHLDRHRLRALVVPHDLQRALEDPVEVDRGAGLDGWTPNS
jgi:hypothetical protein